MEKRAMMIHPDDNVAVLAEAVRKGETIYYESNGTKHTLTASTDVPVYHKVAVRPIQKGESAIKYGCVIGIAIEGIPEGSHVHVHNIQSEALL